MADELKIYDEITKEEIQDPDLENGYLYNGQIQVGETEETYEVMEGTISERNPEGLKRLVPAMPIYEDCQYYHKYTEEEKNPPEPETPTASDYATWDELANAYKEGVNLI